MAPLKQKGDLAELMVAADLRRRGHRIAIPFGEDSDYDLVLDRGGPLEKVQVKYGRSDGSILAIRCRTHSLTGGRVRSTKRYTSASIDWLAVYDAATVTCFYIPAAELGDGMDVLTLRFAPTRNGRSRGIRLAADYLDLRGA